MQLDLPVGVGLEPQFADISDVLDRKAAGIRVYATQLPGLFESDQGLLDDLAGYHARVALAGGVSGYAERYWSTAGTSARPGTKEKSRVAPQGSAMADGWPPTDDAGVSHAIPARSLLGLAVTAAVVVGCLFSFVVRVSDATTAMAAADTRPELTVVKGPLSTGNLTAGDHVRQTMTASAQIDVVYALRTAVTGSDELAAQLQANISNTRTGEVLYAGPLMGAGFDGRQMAVGQPEELVVDVHLPWAANSPGEWGVAVEVGWHFSATRGLSGPDDSLVDEPVPRLWWPVRAVRRHGPEPTLANCEHRELGSTGR